MVGCRPGVPGADPKQWLAHHAADKELWLYKPSKFGLETSYRRYDDVTERLASALAKDLGVPAARVEFAARGTDEGIISLNVTPEGWELHSGDVRLSECPDYVSCSGDDRPKHRVGHNLANIRSILDGCGPPPGFPAGYSAFSVFAATWSSTLGLPTRTGTRSTGPSWSAMVSSAWPLPSITAARWALGSVSLILAGQNPIKFANHGKASRFEGGKRQTLVDLALVAVEQGGAQAQDWVEGVAQYDLARLDDLLDAARNTMRLSEGRRTFIRGILEENQRRLTR